MLERPDHAHLVGMQAPADAVPALDAHLSRLLE